jgi:thioredoxin reductase (NADPH)
MLSTDVVIIGAGPVGLFAIFECGMLKLQCHVIDALDMVGGQCMALYPEKPIYDIPACPSILAQDLIKNLEEQAAPFDPTYHLGQQVTEIKELGDNQFQVTTSKGTVIETKSIVIAAGVGAFGPNRPPLENLEKFEETGSVQYYVRARKDFIGKRIVIAGGGDSAVDWALSLSEIAEHVSLVHRRPKFRAAPESVAQLHVLETEGKIDLVTPYQLAGLKGTDGKLEAVELTTLEGEHKSLPADVLLPFYGLAMNLGPIAEWGLSMNKKHISACQRTAQTSRHGIFAIGDIATYEGKLKLILSGFAEAAQCAHAIRAQLHPDEVFHFEYSTTQGIPNENSELQKIQRS